MQKPKMRLAAGINALVVVELGPAAEETGGFHFSTPSLTCEALSHRVQITV